MSTETGPDAPAAPLKRRQVKRPLFSNTLSPTTRSYHAALFAEARGAAGRGGGGVGEVWEVCAVGGVVGSGG